MLKGLRCQLGDNFLTVYPNIQLSVKDTEDPQTHAPIVATAEMLNAANGKSPLGCTVAAKFSRQFSDEVSWQKVDPQAAAAASGEEDITEGGDNPGGGNKRIRQAEKFGVDSTELMYQKALGSQPDKLANRCRLSY